MIRFLLVLTLRVILFPVLLIMRTMILSWGRKHTMSCAMSERGQKGFPSSFDGWLTDLLCISKGPVLCINLVFCVGWNYYKTETSALINNEIVWKQCNFLDGVPIKNCMKMALYQCILTSKECTNQLLCNSWNIMLTLIGAPFTLSYFLKMLPRYCCPLLKRSYSLDSWL